MQPIILSIHIKNIKSLIVLYYFIIPPLGGQGGDINARSATALQPRSGWVASGEVGAQCGRGSPGVLGLCGRGSPGVRTQGESGASACGRALGVDAVPQRPGGGRSAHPARRWWGSVGGWVLARSATYLPR